MADKTFVNVTNEDIFEKVCSIEHHVIETNGKVKLNKWIGTTALALVFLVAGWLASHTIIG